MVLIDTHVLLWIFSDSGRLTTSARNAISGNAVCVSIASLWEIAIKASLKREDKRLELKESIQKRGCQAVYRTDAKAIRCR